MPQRSADASVTANQAAALGAHHTVKFGSEVEQRQATEVPSKIIEVQQTKTTSVMFPALKVRQGEKLTKVQAAARRSSALNLVYRNLLVSIVTSSCTETLLILLACTQVQYVAVGLGIGGYCILALFTACTSYNTTRQNRHSRYIEAGNLLALYVSVSAGVFVVGAVVWRSFDPAFILKADSEAEEVELVRTRSSSVNLNDKPRQERPQSPKESVRNALEPLQRNSLLLQKLTLDTPLSPIRMHGLEDEDSSRATPSDELFLPMPTVSNGPPKGSSS